jgi:leucyl-tRNA synthetase
MHLLYSRFWQKALHKLGLVAHNEPYKRRANHGMILGPDGNKMSKSKGNVVDPDEEVKLVGADTVKMYLAFMGPYENSSYPWDAGGVAGLRRFLERTNGLSTHIKDSESKETTTMLHMTIKKVAEDIEAFKFNTAISALMVFINHVEKTGLTKVSYESFLRILAPFAPHLTEELWQEAGNTGSIHNATYPLFDATLAQSDTVTIGVQINGKHRGEITIAPDATQATAWAAVEASAELQAKLQGLEVTKIIYVPGRIMNLIAKS